MIKIATVFSGIGAPEFALRRLHIPYKTVFACDNGEVDIEYDTKEEFEKVRALDDWKKQKLYVDELYATRSRKHNYVKDSYLANYGQTGEESFFNDVVLLDGTKFRDKVDLFVGGSPCQSFSVVGSQKGFDDKRGILFFEFIRLVTEIRPKIFIYENVSGLWSKKNAEIWKEMLKSFDSLDDYGTEVLSLNAADYGIPQTRNRVFVVGIRGKKKEGVLLFLPKIENNLTMQDFLIESSEEGGVTFDENGGLLFSKIPGVIDEKYYLSQAVAKYVMTSGTKNWHTKIEIDRKIARPLLSTMGNHHRAGVDNYVTVNGRIRALSERECLRLMGFTDDFKIVVSKASMYKQVGNSMVVDVMMAIFKALGIRR